VAVTGSTDGADITAWAVSPTGEIMLLGSRDNDGHPLFTMAGFDLRNAEGACSEPTAVPAPNRQLSI
jgi:hypothetical protein